MNSASKVKQLETPPRWRYYAAEHWAESTFPATAPVASDSEVCHSLEPYQRDVFRIDLQELPQVKLSDSEQAYWLRRKKFQQNSSAWLASVALHTGLLIALALVSLPLLVPKQSIHVVGILPEKEMFEAVDFHQITIDAPEPVDDSLTYSKLTAGIASVLSPNKSTLSVAKLNKGSDSKEQPVDSLSKIKGMLSSDKTVATVPSKKPSEKIVGGAEFFGVQASGRRFVFVVDSSLSMSGPKWETACQELLGAIDRLTEEQYFYVIFFDGDSHPMFGQTVRISEMELATPENVRHLKQWLTTVQLGFDTSPCQSVTHAIQLRPDAVFLLTDGDFNDYTAVYLRKHNVKKIDPQGSNSQIAVHTICFRNRDGQKVLKRIAKENGGRFRFVP